MNGLYKFKAIKKKLSGPNLKLLPNKLGHWWPQTGPQNSLNNKHSLCGSDRPELKT